MTTHGSAGRPHLGTTSHLICVSRCVVHFSQAYHAAVCVAGRQGRILLYFALMNIVVHPPQSCVAAYTIANMPCAYCFAYPHIFGGGGPVNRLLRLLVVHISEVPGPGPTFGRIFSNLASPRGWMLPILSYCRESARMSLRSGFYHGLWQLYDHLEREPDDVRRQK